jgi:hypothetical protein
MNTRTRTLLTAFALATAASALTSQAEDQKIVRQAPSTPATVVASNCAPETAKQAAQDKWWQQERERDDGYAWPLPSASRSKADPAVAKNSDCRSTLTGPVTSISTQLPGEAVTELR